MKKMKLLSLIVLSTLFIVIVSACHKEEITIGAQANDYFYVQRNGASMFTLVRGNTASKKFLLIVHGGPGDSGLAYSDEYIRTTIEPDYAVVYCDQRNASSSQGTNNSENLTIENMVEDYKSLITVLKQRYGQDIDIFMMAHSFGGLVSAAFMTTNDYQSMVKGWIYVDGAYDYPLNDSLTRVRLIDEGNRQIALGKNSEKWKTIVDYCNEHPGPWTFDESMQLNRYAWEAQSYIDEITKGEVDLNLFSGNPESKLPITAYLINSNGSMKLADQILNATYTSQLHKVNLPVLIIYGKYDFVCPKELGERMYGLVGSTDKEMVISEVSAHSPMMQDREMFYDKVSQFMGRLN